VSARTPSRRLASMSVLARGWHTRRRGHHDRTYRPLRHRPWSGASLSAPGRIRTRDPLLEGTCEASRHVAWHCSAGHLAGRIVWASRLVSLGICHRWLPEWLPEAWLFGPSGCAPARVNWSAKMNGRLDEEALVAVPGATGERRAAVRAAWSAGRSPGVTPNRVICALLIGRPARLRISGSSR
jgi:hypothetical protein